LLDNKKAVSILVFYAIKGVIMSAVDIIVTGTMTANAIALNAISPIKRPHAARNLKGDTTMFIARDSYSEVIQLNILFVV
jgi:hypothetical protein